MIKLAALLSVLIFSSLSRAEVGDQVVYRVQVMSSQGSPMAKVEAVLSEYKTTWLDGTTNKYHKAKTNSNGEAVISYRKDRRHYFDTVICVTVVKGETLCKGLNSLYGPGIMCFKNLKRNENCPSTPRSECGFEITRSNGESLVSVVCG